MHYLEFVGGATWRRGSLKCAFFSGFFATSGRKTLYNFQMVQNLHELKQTGFEGILWAHLGENLVKLGSGVAEIQWLIFAQNDRPNALFGVRVGVAHFEREYLF